MICAVLVLVHPAANRSAHAIDSDKAGIRPSDTEPASALRRVRTLIRANALDLAQTILETHGPTVLPTDLWQAWETQLWTLYAARGFWQRLFDRTRQVPPVFPDSIHRLSDQHAATALIELNQGKEARQILRRRLQLDAVQGNIWKLREFRKLVIRSYLVDGMFLEASTAMQTYQLDYRSRQEDWLLLSAQVYLQTGRTEKAINLTAALDFPSARLLNLYARIIDGSIPQARAIEKLEYFEGLDQSTRVRGKVDKSEVIAVSAYLGKQHGDSRLHLSGIERYLTLTGAADHSGGGRFPVYGLDDLLESYTHYAETEGNQVGLLAGDMPSWLDHALTLPPEKLAEKKSIYGYLLQQINNPRSRFHIGNLFVGTLVESGNISVIRLLFGESAPFGKLVLDGRVGLNLSNRAIEQGDIRLAALINDSLAEIPKEMNRDQWLLHSSRVSIIAGQYAQGARTLRNWVDEQTRLTPEQTDQILQPVFDLQKVGQHKRALELLVRIWPRIATVRHEREVSYWIAESYQATRQFLKAADFFLYSALLESNGFDQWGESARYRAAESLQSARLYSDALTIYSGILNRSDNEQRNAELQQRIQDLELLQGSLESEAGSRIH